MYSVYKIESKKGYIGYSIVAANNEFEANQYIHKFKNDKINSMVNEGYDFVTEQDVIKGLHSNRKGIIIYGIDADI